MDILTVLYSMSGLVFGLAFVPQIVTLVKDRSGATSISLSTWMIFACCSMISLFYACTHSKDIFFIFCSGVGAAGNMIVLILATTRRLQFKAMTNPAMVFFRSVTEKTVIKNLSAPHCHKI